MRVALLVTDLQPGGAPLRIARLARLLRDMEVFVTVGSLAPPGPLSLELQEDGFDVFSCMAHGPRDLGAIRRLREKLRELRPDVLHATLIHANVAARLAARRLAVPVIGSTATIEVTKRWHLWAERCTARRDAAHVVHSKALREHVIRELRIPPERVVITPPIVRTYPPPTPGQRAAARERFGLSDDAVVLLWIGRLDPIKRADWCVAALRDLPERVRLLIVGDGPDRRRVAKAIRAHGAEHRATLTGWLAEPAEALAAADVFLLPSRTEGVPNALLEALSAGTPAVVSNIAAHRGLLGDPPQFAMMAEDSPQGLASTVRELLDRPERRMALSEQALRWSQVHLDPRRAAGQILEVYQRVLR